MPPSTANLEKITNVLAFDYGTRTIGVAAGNLKVGTAQGIDVVTVRNGVPDKSKIDELVATWDPDCFVVGVPQSDSNAAATLTGQILRFATGLGDDYRLPVFETNERLSSEESSNRIRSLGRRFGNRKKADLRNMISAQIILETFLTSVEKPEHPT